MRYQCDYCDEWHEGPPYGYHTRRPSGWDEEVANHPETVEGDDWLIACGKDFFVRGVIEIPVHGVEDPLEWGVWVSLSAENFERFRALADDHRRVEERPYFAWLFTEIPIYEPSTFLLKTNADMRPPGMAPSIVLEPTDHPLAIEQREGITEQRVQQIAGLVLHG